MIKLKRLSKPNLFFLEVALSLMLFVGITFICIQVISSALKLSEQSRELSVATERCEDIAELVRSADSFQEVVDLIYLCFPQVIEQDGGNDYSRHFLVLYDENFNSVALEGGSGITEDLLKAPYRLRIDLYIIDGFGTNISCDVQMLKIADDEAENIYSLNTYHHVGGCVVE